MPSSIVEKYENIFAADPRSRIFVELARAVLERGEPGRAIEVCRTGLEHHPSSILGRVIWGRSLLALGDVPGAQDQFEIAIALDPASPYAYNLVGEALYRAELLREALPVLARAADLQPADPRVRAWLEDARRRLGSSAPTSGEAVEGTRPLSVPLPVPETISPGPSSPAAVTASASAGEGRPPAGDPSNEGNVSGRLTKLAVGSASMAAPERSAAPPPPPPGVAPTARPVRLEPPPLHRDEIPRSLLALIPGATRPDLPAPPSPGTSPPDDEEVDRITARFEQEVRSRLLSEPEPPPPFHRRHRAPLLFAVVLGAGVAAAFVFLHVRNVNRERAAAEAAVRARAGLARDTLGALREASRVLAQARRDSSSPELTSLAAEVAAVLATEHGDPEARALAAELAGRAEAGDGGRAGAYLLAHSSSELVSSEAAILAAPPSSEPLLQALAGRILVRRGEIEAGKGRFEIAARASPPLLRALSDLGDVALAGGDPEGALGYYGAALSAHPTHPRSVVGAAEARLALGLDLPRARADLAALAADPGSLPPQDLKVRYAIVSARVVAALGEPAEAGAQLARSAAELGENAALASARAEIELSARAYDRAEAAAARAVAMAPGDTSARVLLARARIARGRFAEAIAATATAEGRAIWLERGIARYRLGQLAEARRELERTARDGRMPAEAALWYALTDVKLGRAEEARALLEKLAASSSPPPLTSVALGQALEALGRTGEAEAAYRAAIDRDPGAPEPHAALGTLLLARGDAAGAVPELAKAVAADPSDLDVRRTLGSARLATGEPSLARAELDAVLLGRPADLEAICLLSAAWLAEGEPREARRVADRGLARAPGRPSLLLAAARAARAEGDRAAARSLAERAVKAAGRGPEAAAARSLEAELRKRS